MGGEFFEETKWEGIFEQDEIHTEIRNFIQNPKPKIMVRNGGIEIALKYSSNAPG